MSPDTSPHGTRLPDRPHAVLCDLDGTLVDSAPDLARSANAALTGRGHAAVDVDAVRIWVGDGARVLIARCLAGAMDSHGVDACEVERTFASFLDHYRRDVCVDSRLYPGVEAGLAALAARGVHLACVTNKPQAHAEALLEALGLAHRFAAVAGGDPAVRPKPAPDMVLAALDRLRAQPAKSVFVGDSGNDVSAARAAGVPVVGVTYGYNHGRGIGEASPDAVIDSLEVLPALLGHG